MTITWQHALQERGILPEPGSAWPELESARAREQRQTAPRLAAPLSSVFIWLYPDGYAEVSATPAEPFHTLVRQSGLTLNAADKLEITGLGDWLHPVYPASVAALLDVLPTYYVQGFTIRSNLDIAGRWKRALREERWQPYVTGLAAAIAAVGLPVHPYYAWTDTDPDYRRYDYAALEIALPDAPDAARRLAVVFEEDQVLLQLETHSAPPLTRRPNEVLWQAEVYSYLTGEHILLPVIMQLYERITTDVLHRTLPL